MSESAKKGGIQQSKNKQQADCPNRRVLTEALSGARSQELELPQPERGPNMGFDGFLLQLVKGKLKQNKIKQNPEVHISP